jgi:hypothetical protein
MLFAASGGEFTLSEIKGLTMKEKKRLEQERKRGRLVTNVLPMSPEWTLIFMEPAAGVEPATY